MRDPTKTVAVVGRDNDKRLLELTESLELCDGGTDGVIQLKEITEGTVVVQNVHLLVNGGGLGHEEEALVATTGVEDVDSLESHLLQAREVGGGCLDAGGIVVEVLEVAAEDVTVDPDREVRHAEDAESLGAVGSREESRLVQADAVALLGEFLVVILAKIRAGARDELFGTTAKVSIGAVHLGPGCVSEAVEGLLDERAVGITRPSVGGQGDGGSISDEGSRDSAPGRSLHLVRQEGSFAASISVTRRLHVPKCA